VTDSTPIRSPRLELPVLSVPQYERLIAGDRATVGSELGAELGAAWLADARWLIGFRREQLRQHPDHEPWLIRPIIRREEGGPAERSSEARVSQMAAMGTSSPTVRAATTVSQRRECQPCDGLS
jgi:hypothetical protein